MEEDGFHFMPDALLAEGDLSDDAVKVGRDIWGHLLVKFTTTEVTYSSASNPRYVTRIPFQLDIPEFRDRNQHIVRRLHVLMWNQCISRVDWRFISRPPGDLGTFGQSWLMLNAFMHYQMESMTISIAGDSLPRGMFPEAPIMIPRFTFNVEKGNFTDKGDAFDLVKKFGQAGNWRGLITFNFGISQMSYNGRTLIEKVESAISSLTFPQLSDKKLLDHLVRLIRNTETMLEFHIVRFEVPGEADFHLPRGDLSLSIESISPESRVILSCDEELESLTLSASAAERISTTGMRINTLEVSEGDQERDSGESHSDGQHARKKRKQ